MKKFLRRASWLILLLGYVLPCSALQIQTDDDILRDFLWQRFISLPKDKRPQIGLALSAGGVRGFAHVGVLETLDNAGLPIDMISGTSMGSVVGALYAAGLPTEKLWEISAHLTMDNITPDYNAIGLLRFLFAKKLPSSSNLVKFFHEQLGDMQFEDMKIPFSCAAMDVKTGERVVFNSGPLAIAVRASMNLPGVFEPVEYRHRALVDGAVVDYLPVESVKLMGADYIIASVTPPDFYSTTPQSIAAYLLRVGDVRGAAMIEEAAQKANFVLTNRVLDIGTLELDKLHQAGEVGIQEATRNMEALQEDILLFALPYVRTL
ncbi:MAG: patatin-like phospholipase family protein [Candidatus Avelusimicrobium sp.]|uniref:patatin-like phospholipase family protein n=1 Tax=Candidatus Avelusimicrobium sp. TaxID=3048833 RepID=UPI003F1091D8